MIILDLLEAPAQFEVGGRAKYAGGVELWDIGPGHRFTASPGSLDR
jgi:hypothetical protein